MMKPVLAFTLLVMVAPAASQPFVQWGAPAAAAIPGARGYVTIQNAAVSPDKKRTYRAIYNATRAPTEPSRLVPALGMAGAPLHAFAATGVPLRHARLPAAFHGLAIACMRGDPTY